MRARRAAVSFPGHPVRYKSAYSRYKSATRPGGQPFPVLVRDISDGMVTFDMNHELAGKDLTFEIELVEIL